MPSLSLLVRSSPKPSRWCMSCWVWERGTIHSCKKSKASWRYTGTWEQKGGMERALGWPCKPATTAGMSWWTRKVVHDWKGKVLCLYSNKRTWKIMKTTGWSASSQFLWKLQKKKNHMETISKLIKVTRNNQPRFIISKSSSTTLLSVMNWLSLNGRSTLAAFHANISEVFDIVSLVAKQDTWTEWLTTRWVRDWLHGQAQRIMVSGSEASWWPIPSTAWLPRNVISSNISHLQPSAEHTVRKLTEDKLVECLINGCQSCHSEKMTGWRNTARTSWNIIKAKNQGPVSGTKPPQPLALAVE